MPLCHITGTELFPETSDVFNHVIRLLAQEGFVNVALRETFISYLRQYLGFMPQVIKMQHMVLDFRTDTHIDNFGIDK